MYRLALRRPVSTFVGTATLAALGAFSLLRLPVSLLPEVGRPALVVSALARNRSQEEMRRGLTEPYERRLASLPSLASLRSETADGSTRLVLQAAWQADPDRLRIDAARRLSGAGEFQPDELSITVTGGETSPVVEVAVLAGESGAARTAFAKKVLLPELARLPGAGRIELIGASPLHAVVRPLAAALAARGLTAEDVVARLSPVGRPVSAGRLRDGGAVRPVVVNEPVRSLDELRAVRVGGAPLGDLAVVGLEEVRDGTSYRRDREPAVLLAVYRAPGANAVALARLVQARVASLSSRSLSGLRLEIVSDQSHEVIAALEELLVSALIGLALGTLVLRLMLGAPASRDRSGFLRGLRDRWAPTLALSAVIPASLLASFAAFHLFGVPLDVVSLAGLALAAGMLVDNSIVVLESIEAARARGEADPVLAGTRQIAVAVVASCATALVVFLPLLYVRGLARAFFGEQAFAVVTSLAASLLFSLTLTPVLARGDRPSGASAGRSPGLAAYRSILDRLLARPVLALAVGGGVALASLASVRLLPRELFPEGESRTVVVATRFAESLSDEEAEREVRAVEEAAWRAAQPLGATSIEIVHGVAPEAALSSERSVGRLRIELPDSARARRAVRALSVSLAALPGVVSRVRLKESAFVAAVSGEESELELVVSAPEEDGLPGLVARVSHEVERATRRRPVPEDEGRAEGALHLVWDEARLAALGTARASLEAQVRAAVGPSEAGRVEMSGVEPEISVEATTPANLALLPVRLAAGGAVAAVPRVVPLAAVARVAAEGAPSRLLREEGRPAARLRVPSGTGESRVDALDLEKALGRLPLGAGERVLLAGEALDVARSFSEMRLALALSLVLVFLTIAAVYESLLLPPLVMSAVPVAAGGALLALAASAQSLNLMSAMGLILLSGIVANHTIVLVDRIEQLRDAGIAELEALRSAAAERYRPIVMTTATTVFGMLPLALLGGEGVELRRALATAVLGGLVTSTFASLLLVPVLHLVLEPFRRRRGAA